MINPEKRIIGERVYLREMVEADAPFIVEWRNDEEIMKWMFNQEKITIESHLMWFGKKSKTTRKDYIICDITNNLPIGTVNYSSISSKNAEAGKMIGNKSYWGGGYAKEAYLLWLEFGFKSIGLESVFTKTMKNNTPNIRSNEKIGFKVIDEYVSVVNDCFTNISIMEIHRSAFYHPRKMNEVDS